MNVEQLKKKAQTNEINYPFAPIFPDMSQFKMEQNGAPSKDAERAFKEYEEEVRVYAKTKVELEDKVYSIFAKEYGFSTETVKLAFDFSKEKFEYEEFYGYILELEKTLKVFSQMQKTM